MKNRIKKIRSLEQLEMFADVEVRPRWNDLPEKTRKRISELIANLLVDHMQNSDTSIDCKEVVNER